MPAIPPFCRFTIRAASLIVPPAMREDWLKEWCGELWHRVESGAPSRDVFRCARGAFRDALWFRSSEYAQAHLASEGFLAKPLRPEFALLAAALLLCLASGAFRAPSQANPNAKRLVRMERGIGFLGALDLIFQRELLSRARSNPAFEQVAAYHWSPANLSCLRVSPNFFDLLGARPILGRTFQPGDDDRTIVLSEAYWKHKYRRDRNIVGSVVFLGGEPYMVAGVVGSGLQFSSLRVNFYGLLEGHPRFAGAIALLRPGVSIASAQGELRKWIQKSRVSLGTSSLLLSPLWADSRRGEALFAAIVSLFGALCGLAFVLFQRLGGLRYRLLLGARLVVLLSGLCGMRLAFSRLIPAMYGPVSFFQFWIFLLICCGAAFLVVRDHRDRCVVCLRRMLMPAPIGTWSSALLDQPATEYVCPAGHGTLYVAETGDAPVHWTVLDESWQDLFVHR